MLVTISCLGNYGRFGNQLFQYAYARAFAEQLGAELHTPDWIGRELFIGVDEPIMQNKGDIDLFDYFQNPEHLELLSRKKVKEWFQFKNPPKVEKHNVIFNKRRGDYLTHADQYPIVSDQSYIKGAQKFGLDYTEALVLDQDNPDFLTDFCLMMNCNNLFRANSTFSWWAATLGDCEVYSPKVEDKTGWVDVEFVKGNDEWNYRFNKYLIIKD
jgi:hypothetical protein